MMVSSIVELRCSSAERREALANERHSETTRASLQRSRLTPMAEACSLSLEAALRPLAPTAGREMFCSSLIDDGVAFSMPT